MFNGGIWLNTYELPYSGGAYMKSSYMDKWETTGSEKVHGNMIKALYSVVGIDFPGYAEFKHNGLMTKGRSDIEIDFFLLNKNINWLEKNFQFIQSFFAGTMWLHTKYCKVQPSNVYHVLCPGRFQIYWASVNCEVTFQGKLRKIPNFSRYLNKKGIKSIDEDMLWPDAWKMHIAIHDITPNNYNLYAEYYRRGFCAEEVAELAVQMNTAADLRHNFTKYLGLVADEFKDIVGYAGGFIRDVAESLQKKVSNSSGLPGPLTSKKEQFVGELADEAGKIVRNDPNYNDLISVLTGDKKEENGQPTENPSQPKQ